MFIWMPWILKEDLEGIVEIVSHAYLHYDDIGIFIFQIMMTMAVFGYNTRAILQNSSHKIFKMALFNLSLGYTLLYGLPEAGLILTTICLFIGFYDLKEIAVITTASLMFTDISNSKIFSTLNPIYMLLIPIAVKLYINSQFVTEIAPKVHKSDINSHELSLAVPPMLTILDSTMYNHNSILHIVNEYKNVIDYGIIIILPIVKILLSEDINTLISYLMLTIIFGLSHLLLKENLEGVAAHVHNKTKRT